MTAQAPLPLPQAGLWVAQGRYLPFPCCSPVGSISRSGDDKNKAFRSRIPLWALFPGNKIELKTQRGQAQANATQRVQQEQPSGRPRWLRPGVLRSARSRSRGARRRRRPGGSASIQEWRCWQPATPPQARQMGGPQDMRLRLQQRCRHRGTIVSSGATAPSMSCCPHGRPRPIPCWLPHSMRACCSRRRCRRLWRFSYRCRAGASTKPATPAARMGHPPGSCSGRSGRARHRASKASWNHNPKGASSPRGSSSRNKMAGARVSASRPRRAPASRRCPTCCRSRASPRRRSLPTRWQQTSGAPQSRCWRPPR
jgi:hypothetical protein